MRKPYLALVTAAGLLLAVGVPAEAGNGRTGGGSASFMPPGINGNTHLDPFTTTGSSPTTTFIPRGWEQGKGAGADWKSSISGSTATPPLPPGLNAH